MKFFSYFFLSVLMLYGCASGGMVNPTSTGENIIKEQPEEEEYDIIIDDPGFYTWLSIYGYPTGYHSNDYYRHKNNALTSEWNSRFYSRGGRYPYNFSINYDPSIDYGFNVNYKLFHYFRFLKAQHGINIGMNLPGI